MDLSPLATSNASAAAASMPRGFRPISGMVKRIVKCNSVEYERKHGSNASKSAGLLYEAQVQVMLQEIWPHYEPEPAFEFYDDSGFRLIRPDGILQTHDRVVVFEIKRYHEPGAWWQLFRLYGPVVAQWSRKFVQCCEITRSYDPQLAWPGPIDVVQSLKDWTSSKRALSSATSGTMGVFPWRK